MHIETEEELMEEIVNIKRILSGDLHPSNIQSYQKVLQEKRGLLLKLKQDKQLQEGYGNEYTE